MNSSLALHHPHNRSWLHSQQVLKRLSTPPPPAASSPSPSSYGCPSPPAPPWPPFSPHPASPSPDSEAASPSWDDADFPTSSPSPSSGSFTSSDSSGSWGASSSPYRGPSSASSDPWMPGNQFVPGPSSYDAASPAENASFEDDVFMDPVIEYIDDIIMHGNMDDRKCMQHECLSFQATGSRACDSESALRSSYGVTDRGGDFGDSFISGAVAAADHTLREEDYRWIENVLVGDPLAEADRARNAPVSFDASPYIMKDAEAQPAAWLLPRAFSDLSSARAALSNDYPLSAKQLPAYARYGRMAESVFNPSELPLLPVLNHDNFISSLSAIPSTTEFKLNGSAFRPDSFVNGHAGVAGRRLAPNPMMRSVAINGFSGTTEESKSFPLIKVDDSLLKNGLSVERTQVPPAAASVEEPLSFVQNEYLKAEKHAKMYEEGWPDEATLESLKELSQSRSGKKNGKADPVDLRSLLVDCAQAVGANNLRKANDIVVELKQHTSPTGTATQRLSHYFTEALIARLAGTGAQQYTAMSTNRPSAAETLKAMCLILKVCPYVKLAHFFCNQNILKAAEGATCLHIVDFGILYGVQWPALMSYLAGREGGPPILRITGIEFPQPGSNPAERVRETGVRLGEYAKKYNVPFEYQSIAKRWEDIEPSDVNLRQGEVLAVNCVQRLRHLMDETVVSDHASPRRKVLSRIRSLKPDIVVIAILNAGYNAPFFVSRFREALYHYSSKFDIIETAVADNENPHRLMMERECIARDIINIVACEGHERVERPETYRQWQSRFQRAGFEQQKLDQSLVRKTRDVVRTFYHKDFYIDDDSKWMLLGWKGRIMEGLSAWRPSSRNPVL